MQRSRAILSVTLALAIGYAVLVAGTGLAVGLPEQALRGLVGGLLIAGLGGIWGSGRSTGFRLSEGWPGWSRSLPGAVASAQGVLLVAGCGALAASLVLHLDRVVQLNESLHAGIPGGIAILLAQLAFLPNAVIWAGSYALGAGFSVGQGTVIAPSASTLGLLPPFPILGALPGAGGSSSWPLLWLLAGGLAGVVAAWQAVRRRPAARFDQTTLVGGLSGVLAALVFVLLGWFSSGDLGDARLTGLGPRLLPLLVLAASTLGLSGMVCGLVIGLSRQLRRRRAGAGR